VLRYFNAAFGINEQVAPPVSSAILTKWFLESARKLGLEPSDHETPLGQKKTIWSGRLRTFTGSTRAGWKLHSSFIVANSPTGPHLDTTLSVRDIRHMARLLRLSGPSHQTLEAWTVAANGVRANARDDGHLTDPIQVALRR
jgi:hypothetical protein